MNIKGLMNKRVADAKNTDAELEARIKKCVHGLTDIEFQKKSGGTYAFVYTKNTFINVSTLNDWISETGAFDIDVNQPTNGTRGLVYSFFWQK